LENQRFQGFLFAKNLFFTPLGDNLGIIVAKNCKQVHSFTSY